MNVTVNEKANDSLSLMLSKIDEIRENILLIYDESYAQTIEMDRIYEKELEKLKKDIYLLKQRVYELKKQDYSI